MAFSMEIDEALKTLLNETQTVTIGGSSYAVPAFIAAPEEQFRKFGYPKPSISIMYMGCEMRPDREVDRFKTFSDRTATTINEREAPVKADLTYQITTSAYFQIHDRTLQELVMSKVKHQGYLTVNEAGYTKPAKYRLHVVKVSEQILDRNEGEYRHFIKAYTFKISGWLDKAIPVNKTLAYQPVELHIGLKS